MITAHLQGGLGNQMFQISAATALAIKNSDKVVLDVNRHHLPLQGRRCKNYADNIFRNVKFTNIENIENIYNESSLNYSKIPYKKNMQIRGYFQSEKYFVDHEKEIRSLFSPSLEIEEYINSKYGKYILKDNITSIHIRRGDYLKFSDTHPPCSKEYYAACFSELPSKTLYLVFSDDPEWCKNNFKASQFHIVSGEEDYIDLYLMSKCHNNIIANSSFSWWGAWLNNNAAKKVFAPKRWFGPACLRDASDIIPEEWGRR